MSRRRNSTANINNTTVFRNSLPPEALRDHEDKAFHAIYDELKATGEKLVHKCFFLIRKAATMIAKGSAASPGAACGKVCFTQDEALAAKANKEDAILVTVMTSQEDVKGMKASRGILTTTGTKVSHAAIMATAWGIPAVVGASEITIDKAAGTFSCKKKYA